MDPMSLVELRAAKEAAEAAHQRSAFLAEASALLTASLDYEATLSSLARLTVPRVGDYCILYEIDEGREVRQVALAHVDPDKEPLLASLGELYRPSLDQEESLVARAVRSGEPVLLASSTLEAAQSVTRDEDLLDLYRRLDPRSVLVLPLAARGQMLGALMLATAESGRTYGESDVELGRELSTRAAVAMDNARLYREAQRANAAKDQFLAALSHELRTPLAPVLAVVSALESDSGIRASIGGALAVIRRNIELEARLIDDLLDLTRISRGKLELHLQPSDLRDALAHALQSCSAQDDAGKWIAVETEFAAVDHIVCADVPRLTQVFWNLLKNAFKFTPDGGTVRVRTRHESWDGRAGIAVEVADTGIGISHDLLPRIFDSFEQGERSITRRFGGLGLGLAISKALVELHKGRITVASDGEGRGSTFTVWVPCASRIFRDDGAAVQPSGTDGDGSAPDPGRQRPLRILLVEDHVDTAAAVADLLDLLGHQVIVAHNVASGLAAAATALEGAGLDLVISDLGLPDGSGLDLMRELSGRHGLRGIALSGYGAESDVRASAEAGFALHLTKPVDLERLRGALRS